MSYIISINITHKVVWYFFDYSPF